MFYRPRARFSRLWHTEHSKKLSPALRAGESLLRKPSSWLAEVSPHSLPFTRSHLAGSNCGPLRYECNALPTELRWRLYTPNILELRHSFKPPLRELVPSLKVCKSGLCLFNIFRIADGNPLRLLNDRHRMRLCVGVYLSRSLRAKRKVPTTRKMSETPATIDPLMRGEKSTILVYSGAPKKKTPRRRSTA